MDEIDEGRARGSGENSMKSTRGARGSGENSMKSTRGVRGSCENSLKNEGRGRAREVRRKRSRREGEGTMAGKN